MRIGRCVTTLAIRRKRQLVGDRHLVAAVARQLFMPVKDGS